MFLNERGSTIASSLFTLGITMVAILAMVNFVKQKKNHINITNANSSAVIIRSNLNMIINDPLLWQQTVGSALNTSFDCLRNNTNCIGQGGPIYALVQDDTGTIYYRWHDSAQPFSEAGFNLSGGSCSGFGVDGGTEGCPFQVELFWEPVCVAPCNSNVLMKITGRFKYDGSVDSSINLNKYGFTLFKLEP